MLIDFERDLAKQFAYNLTDVGGIISTPVDFSLLNALSIFLSSCSDTGKKEEAEFWGF